MAKIMGLQLKGLKYFQGMEGTGFNANLYLNNKKVAFCMDEGCGGEMSIQWLDFKDTSSRESAYKIANEYYEKYPKSLFYTSDEGKLVEVIEELISLSEVEKWYKKQVKAGFKIVVDIRYNKRTSTLDECDFTKNDIQVCYVGWNSKTEENMKEKYKPVEYTVYKSLDDFNIA